MTTKDLERELINAESFDEAMVKQNAAPEFYKFIDDMLAERGMKRADVIAALDLDRNYGYQILNGTRVPTKRQVVLIGLLLGVNVEQLQRLLKVCGRECLYVRNIDDAKVMYAIEHGYAYEKAVEFIYGAE